MFRYKTGKKTLWSFADQKVSESTPSDVTVRKANAISGYDNVRD